MRNNKLSFISFIFVICMLIFGIIRLFAIRFETGDIYPVYSTLRSDPLGCMVFHDSMLNLKILTVARNYNSIIKTKQNGNSVLFFIGMHPSLEDTMPNFRFEALNSFVLAGGRLVLTFAPIGESFVCNISKRKGEAVTKKVKTEKSDNPTKFKPVSLSKSWGFKYDSSGMNFDRKNKSSKQSALLCRTPSGSVSWHSKLVLTELSKEWEVIATTNGAPAIIERKYGNGSIIICTDTYFISNEGLRNESVPALLAFLIGKNRNIIFDEAHFGIQKKPGIASLIFRYNLFGTVITLFIFAILFVWKNASHFLPPVNTVKTSHVSARDQSSSLISLLKRNIKKDKLLNICINEWEKSFASGSNSSKRNMELVEQMRLRAQARKDGAKQAIELVDGYREIFKLLSEGKNR